MVEFILILGAIIMLWYYIYIQWVKRNWDNIEDIIIPNDFEPTTRISIIIAVRNEEEYIEQCITSLIHCNYPDEYYEVIIIDDHSDDQTVGIIEGINSSLIKLLHLKDYLKTANINAYKKAALQYGIESSTGELIVITDGDSWVKPDFLRVYAYCYMTNEVSMMAGIVQFEQTKSLIEHFQQSDMISMMGITGAGIESHKYYMANGANLVFDKKQFLSLEPYDHNGTASGDDMFLIQSLAKKQPERIRYIKDKRVLVTTAVTNGYSAFWEQRKRWASKSSQYKDPNIKWLMVLIFIVNIGPFISIVFSTILGSNILSIVAILAVILKFVIDYFYIKKISNYFSQPVVMKYFVFSFFFYYIYIIYTGFIGLFPSNYRWKQRNVK